ncbi:lytic murein transglycosylase [Pseudooceanicola sp. MF1-13]|uniref:lytic murein transglycosylase n=1 Tax=Pseudooceanicola sp. MF1-13 TaxID=3379095 RepID=UPI0038911E38
MRPLFSVAFASLVVLLPLPAVAVDAFERSLRPMVRPGSVSVPKVTQVRGTPEDASAIAALAVQTLGVKPLSPAAQQKAAPAKRVVALRAASLRPKTRPVVIQSIVPTAAVEAEVSDATAAGFRRWIASFRGRAMAKGINGQVYDRTFAHVEYLPEVIKLDRKQSEFTKTTGEYLASAVSDTRVSTGRDKATAQRGSLNAIQAKYGVDKHIVAAIWGMETNFGSYRGNTHIPSALATLAYDGRRGSFFESQLIAALNILQQGDTTPDNMRGSWAGAMGHTQFMPTSYEAYAVDFTGDGRRDIWAEDPTDALASTAAYLDRMGWVSGQPWGVEVTLPSSFNFALATTNKYLPSQWARLGVRAADGRTIPDHGEARVLLPAGAKGAAFLVFKNFDVIKRYNNSDAYALGVGHLGDRIAGGGPLRGTWPAGERALKRAERQELQSLLTRAGFSTGGVDGMIGPNTVGAIRRYQERVGMIPDGHPSVDLLNRLRG